MEDLVLENCNQKAVLDPALNCEGGKLRSGLKYWNEIRSGQVIPRLSDFDAVDIPADVWPHITMIDVAYEPAFRVRWRLIGTAITGLLKRDLTGMYWDEIYPGDAFNIFAEPAARVIDGLAPMRFTAKGHIPNKTMYDAEHIYLPLSLDGRRVDRIFAVSEFTLTGFRYATAFQNVRPTGHMPAAPVEA